MTLVLIDQSDPEKLKFHCTRCEREVVLTDRALVDFHAPVLSADAVKLKIPPCQPLPVAAVQPLARKRQPKAVPAPEVVVPKKRGHPRKAESAS